MHGEHQYTQAHGEPGMHRVPREPRAPRVHGVNQYIQAHRMPREPRAPRSVCKYFLLYIK